MNVRLLNIAIASIRFDKVPPGVTSVMFERTILPLYGDILEWEYTLRRYISEAKLESKVTRDLNGKLGEEILRLCRLGLSPVLCVQYFCWDWGIRLEVGHETLRRFAKKGRSMVMTFPSGRLRDQYGFQFSDEFIELLARYNFSMEIM